MDMRELGRSGIKVPKLCFGGNVFGWTADEARSFELLDALVDADLTFIDTANVYSAWVPGHQGGESEAIIGRWLKARGGRDKLVIATKVGMKMGDGRQGLKPDYIRVAVEESLQRLQTDYIDLYQSHSDDKSVPIEETLGAYGELIKAGKVRAIGASNYQAGRLKEALAIAERTGLPRYESVQPEYNLMTRTIFEGDLEEACLENHVGVINFYGLAAGFLTGKYRTKADTEGKNRGSRVEKYLTERGIRILDTLDEVAKAHGVKPASVALAWLMARPAITAPIASATSVAQMQDLVAALSVRLDADEIAKLDMASA
jgi:aryl-alcohol dehydrogenase-like predicted oxidoreductase